MHQVSNRYYTGKNVHCRNCNRTGHLSKNCPDPKVSFPSVPGCVLSLYLVSADVKLLPVLCMLVCVQKLVPCFLCGTPGHLASECPNKHCNNCGQPGHLFNSCSEKAYWHKQCHRCSMTGHFFDVSTAFLTFYLFKSYKYIIGV